jgi:hypothetical protein
MTDREISYAKMARQLYRVLTDQRPQWEDRDPSAVADFEQLNAYLQAIDEVAARQGGQGSAEYADARDWAEHSAEEAAGLLVRSLRTLHSSVPNPAIAKAASYTPDQLDPLHGPDLLAALNEIAAAAENVRPLLANAGVTDEQVEALTSAINLYTPLAELPSSNQSQGGKLSGTARELTKSLRGLVQRFDQFIDSLREEIPGLAERYDEARAADANYVPQTSTPREGGDGSEGGVGPEVAGNASGPEPKPFQ